jgi:hypothetical protein
MAMLGPRGNSPGHPSQADETTSQERNVRRGLAGEAMAPNEHRMKFRPVFDPNRLKTGLLLQTARLPFVAFVV